MLAISVYLQGRRHFVPTFAAPTNKRLNVLGRIQYPPTNPYAREGTSPYVRRVRWILRCLVDAGSGLAGNGIQSVAWYIDRETGDNLDRPDFSRLQADIFAGQVKTVVVWKLDRLSRSLQDGINTLCDWLGRGVRLVSVTQQLDFAGPTGKLIASVLFAVAEMEQQTRRERQAAGIAVAKQEGRYRGRKSGSLKADASRAVELRKRGLHNSEIAKALGVTRRTVQRYLSGLMLPVSTR